MSDLEPTTRPHRSAATRIAAAGALLLALALLLLAGLAFARATGALEGSRSLAVNGAAATGVGTSQDELEAASALVGLIYTASFLVVLPIGIGVLRWRSWAREAGMAVFALGGLLITLISFAGLRQDPPGDNSALGLICGLAIVGLAGALAHPACANDFSRYEAAKALVERRRRAAERRAAAGPPDSAARTLN